MDTEVSKQSTGSGKWFVLSILAAGIVLFFSTGLGHHLTLASLKENKEALQGYTEIHYTSAVILFILTFALQSALSIPGTVVLTLSGGVLFGSLLGTIYVNVGATVGATVAFLTARYLFRDVVERKYGKKLDPIQQGFSNHGFRYLVTIRLIPIFPFFLVNLAAGLTRIRLRTYVSATSIGIIPLSFVFSNAGKRLGEIRSTREIASPEIIGACILLGLLSLLPVVYHRIKKPVEAKTR